MMSLACVPLSLHFRGCLRRQAKEELTNLKEMEATYDLRGEAGLDTELEF